MKFISKLARITNGWKNYMFTNPLVEELAKVRSEICADCDQAKESEFLKSVLGKVEKVSGMICDNCKCPISAKVRSVKESCPLDNW